MVNYKAIADEAEGYEDYISAFNIMSAQMDIPTFKDMSPNALKMWAATFSDDYQLLHAGTDAFSKLAISMIHSESTPLFISDYQVHSFINALPISQSSIDGVYLMATKTNKLWPQLKLGHVQNAMQKRAEGKI